MAFSFASLGYCTSLLHSLSRVVLFRPVVGGEARSGCGRCPATAHRPQPTGHSPQATAHRPPGHTGHWSLLAGPQWCHGDVIVLLVEVENKREKSFCKGQNISFLAENKKGFCQPTTNIESLYGDSFSNQPPGRSQVAAIVMSDTIGHRPLATVTS